ncbi:MAG: FAD-dependent oxidoreductase [Burkholderiaceae bacterium]|nr:FAD-dependent oxidoreductase [Burkholderiaceae bacterium]
MNKKKLAIVVLLALIVVAFFASGLHKHLTLDAVKARQGEFQALFASNPLTVAGTFFLVYVLVAATSLPGAAVMTLLAGAVFGFWWGLLIVSFASTIGATLAFLASRFLLRDSIQGRFGARLASINRGVEKEGWVYLLTLRLIPIFPFWLVNLLMGVTPIPTRVFYVVSQLGMLAGTAIYVNFGTQLASIESLRGLLSPGVVISLVLLGLAAPIGNFIARIVRTRKVYAKWQKPERFDRNIVVIGGGSAGLVTAYIGAAVKANVTLVEKHRMGGDCLNFGCVPSKALIKSARVVHQARHASSYGLRRMDVEFDFADIMERVKNVVAAIEPHDSVERYRDLGVDVVLGDARIVSPWEVEVSEQDPNGGSLGTTRRIRTRSIVIAAGASPFVPPIPGIEAVGYLTSDNLWELRTLPSRLLVLGGGPIGCELSQAFARLGARVTQVEMAPRLMMREDPDVSQLVQDSFVADGIDLRLQHKAVRFERRQGQKVLVAQRPDGSEIEFEFDELLCAVGRSARVSGYGLEDLEIPLARTRTIEVNEFLETNYPNIFACGDVAGPYQFTHTAAHMAWYAAVNALFGMFRRFKVDYSVIPWATFTSPEVARVGLNEQDARERGIPYEVTRYGIDDLDRAIADEVAHGFVKVLTSPGKDRILGATIVGEHAGDLIAEFVFAMKHGLGLNKVLGTIHIYPTLAEANKYAAGEWKRAHAPQRVLEWLRRFHRWRLGGPAA